MNKQNKGVSGWKITKKEYDQRLIEKGESS